MKKTYLIPVFEWMSASVQDVIATSLLLLDEASKVQQKDVYSFHDRFGQ